MFNTMAADGLVTQAARASEAMVLALFPWNLQSPFMVRFKIIHSIHIHAHKHM